MSDNVWWLVVAPLNKFLVAAGSEEQARKAALKAVSLDHKSYLADRWEFRVATEQDKRDYAVFADNHRKSQPTLKTAKRKTKTASERLFGG